MGTQIANPIWLTNLRFHLQCPSTTSEDYVNVSENGDQGKRDKNEQKTNKYSWTKNKDYKKTTKRFKMKTSRLKRLIWTEVTLNKP